jgi:hypothetical protein
MWRFFAYRTNNYSLLGFIYIIKNAKLANAKLPDWFFMFPWRFQARDYFLVPGFLSRLMLELHVNLVQISLTLKRS